MVDRALNNLPFASAVGSPVNALDGAASGLKSPNAILPRLATIAESHGLEDLAQDLARLEVISELDLATIERELASIPRQADVVDRSAAHLLDRGGKRLRPLLVALAARVGSGFSEAGLGLAVAVELVHSATLLHDDVVDLGDKRRGAPAARMIYGNAASIFAGDWLLVDALRRVRQTGYLQLLDRLLAVIEEMIHAEALQLERRGALDLDLPTYFRVIEGKTASLFRWALYAGGTAGGLGAEMLEAAERYGHHLGVAFQLVDDVIDFGVSSGGGDQGGTAEKTVLADIREGKLTYPLLLAIERDPSVTDRLRAIIASESSTEGGTLMPSPEDTGAYRGVVDAVVATGAIADTLALARRSIHDAEAALAVLPAGEGRTLLQTIAEATTFRTR